MAFNQVDLQFSNIILTTKSIYVDSFVLIEAADTFLPNHGPSEWLKVGDGTCDTCIHVLAALDQDHALLSDIVPIVFAVIELNIVSNTNYTSIL